jgi:NAD-dependent deacetylase
VILSEDLIDQLDRAATLFRSSRKAVAFTGAGISVPSGIPDFRSASTGLWNRFNPMEVASLTAFRRRPEAFYQWLDPLARQMLEAVPNAAHRALVELQTAGFVQTIITQNIDGLFQKAGALDVIELHGNMDRMICPRCHEVFNSRDFQVSWLDEHRLPRCGKCGDLLKPDIILYEEMLPADAWEQAEEACELAELILVTGTSLEVMPAATLPLEGFHRGAKLIFMNLSSTQMDSLAEAVIPMDVADGLPELARRVFA